MTMEKTPSKLWTPFGGPQETTIISEPGLYKLIQTSRKPAAKRFDRWVCNTNLPLIDQTVFTLLPLRRPNQNLNFLFGRLSQ
jgi:prophage antirepressor-like protein